MLSFIKDIPMIIICIFFFWVPTFWDAVLKGKYFKKGTLVEYNEAFYIVLARPKLGDRGYVECLLYSCNDMREVHVPVNFLEKAKNND